MGDAGGHRSQLRRRRHAVGHVDYRRRDGGGRDTVGSSRLAASIGDPAPLYDMGRFSHEACMVDPNTGYVYETEDDGDSSGFYKFVPFRRGNLKEGGDLYMLKVKNVDQADLRTVSDGGHDLERGVGEDQRSQGRGEIDVPPGLRRWKGRTLPPIGRRMVGRYDRLLPCDDRRKSDAAGDGRRRPGVRVQPACGDAQAHLQLARPRPSARTPTT